MAQHVGGCAELREEWKGCCNILHDARQDHVMAISETHRSLSVVVLLLRVVTPATHTPLSTQAPPTKHKARDAHDSSPQDPGLPAHVLQAHLVPELFELLVRQVDIEPAPQTQHAQYERQESLGGVAGAWARKARRVSASGAGVLLPLQDGAHVLKDHRALGVLHVGERKLERLEAEVHFPPDHHLGVAAVRRHVP